MEGSLASPLLQQVERGRESRRKLYGRLCRLGVMIRLLTMLNAIAIVGAAGYSLYIRGAADLMDVSLGLEPRVRIGVEYCLCLITGTFLWLMESTTTSEEASMRSSLGLAFGPAGRLSLFLFLALCSAPAIHCDHTLIECYASGGAVAFLIVSALLQAWMLSCAPEYRGTVVASLEIQKIKTDSTPDVFPQIYQRDEGTHLHLGVLIPGFASRDTCTMSANCSAITLVGDISHLEAPYSPVDSSNSVTGPFGSFQRDVQLATPVDITVPVESRMGLGILEFRFQKGVEVA